MSGQTYGFGRRCVCGAYVQAVTWEQLQREWQRHAAQCQEKLPADRRPPGIWGSA